MSNNENTGQFNAIAGYCLTTIGEVCDGNVSQAGPAGEFVYLDIGSVDRESKTFFDLKTVSLKDAPSRARQVVQPGDVLVSMTRPNLNAVALVRGLSGEAIASTGFHVLRSPWVDTKYLYYLVQTEAFIQAMTAVVQGALYPAVRPKDISSFALNLPPRAEQTRIVEKLEELLSDLDAGVAELKAAQRKLAQYRQSLLKAAVEGALTAEWRAARAGTHPPPRAGEGRGGGAVPPSQPSPARGGRGQSETGAELLQRILRERRARWEQKQLAKFAEQGKTPPKGWQEKYPEPVAPDLTDLPPLPEGWVWASLGQLLESITSGSRDWAPYYDRGTCTFVMAQNVRPWRPDFTFRQMVDPPSNDRDRARSKIEMDDLLITIVGANTGQCCRVPTAIEDYFVCQSVALLRATERSMSEFLNAVLNSSDHGQRQFREMNYGAGRPHLSFEQIESVLVPLPPVAEQEQMISVVEEGNREIGVIDLEITKALKHAVAQRKNLLKAAFSGRLVPQDPNDEPASELLARIRAQREANPGAPARKRGRKAKGAA